MAGHNYSKKDVKKAIEASNGLVQSVAVNLGCAWDTARKYIRKHNLQDLMDIQNEVMLDKSETMLFANIQNGSEKSIFFHLRNKGKSRGYSDLMNSQPEDSGTNELIAELMAKLEAKETE